MLGHTSNLLVCTNSSSNIKYYFNHYCFLVGESCLHAEDGPLVERAKEEAKVRVGENEIHVDSRNLARPPSLRGW